MINLTQYLPDLFAIIWIVMIIWGVLDDIVKAKRATLPIRNKKIMSMLCEALSGGTWIWYCVDYLRGDAYTVPASILCASFVLITCAIANENTKWHDEEEDKK